MAEKIVSIKIVANTDNAGNSVKKLAVEFDKLEKSQVSISGIEKKRTELLQAQEIASAKLLSTTAKLAQSNLNINFANKAVEASYVGYRNEINKTSKALAELALLEGKAKSGARLTTPATPQQGFSFTSGVGGVSQAKEASALAAAQAQKDFDLVESKMKSFAARRVYLEDQLGRDIVSIREKAETIATAKMSQEAHNREAIIKESADKQRKALADLRNQIISNNSIGGDAVLVKDKQTKAQDRLNKSLLDGTKAHKNLFIHVGEIIGAYRILNSTINLVQQAILAIPKAGLQQEANQAGLLGIFGSEEARKNLQFVSDVATNAGQSITILERAYARYASSAILAGASQKEVNKSFKDFAELGTILKLPEEKIDSLFLALDQMFAKGVVQSEEIKKQLGNVLPGAVEIGAQAIGKTPAAFMKAMSENLVIAKEFVPLFAAKYREIFGGPDDAVFRLVSDKLQSNLERVQNEFTFIARDIYASTKTYMNNTVKLFAEGLTSIRENLTGIGQALEIFSAFLAARFSIALVEAAANVGILLKKLPSLVTAFTGLPAPITAVGAAMGGLYVYLNDLSVGYSKAEGFTVSFQDQTVSLTSYIKATALQVLEDLNSVYEKLRGTIESIAHIDITSVFKGLIPDQETVVKFAAHIQALKDSFSLNPYSPTYDEAFTKNYANLTKYQEDINKKSADRQQALMAKAGELDMEAYIKGFNGKGAGDVSQAISEGKLKSVKDITDALAQADLTIKAPTLTAIEETTPDTKKQKELLKAVKADYKEITETIKTATKEIATDFAYNESRYSQNLITLKEYLAEKKSLIDAELESKSSLQRGLISVASNAGDTSKVNQAEEELLRLKEVHEKKLIDLSTEGYEKKLTQISTLRSIEIDYYNAIGQADKAITLQYEDKYVIIKESLQRQIDAGDTLKQIDLDRINSLEKLAVVESQVAIAKASVQGKLNLTAADQERINVLRNIGAISELTAAQQLSGVYEKEIELKQRLIDIDVKRLESLPQGTSAYQQLKDDIDQATASLENFKLTSNTVGQYFQTQLTPAFTNAFTGFITGSMTAKEAFASFAQDMLKRIADIAAQELASQIIGGLIGAAGSLFGGSSVDAFGANASGRIVKPMANGGITSGMGIGNGVVLSSATYFPNAKPVAFADGGVVAGEAGYEAALPLKRMSNGKLGVETTGSSGSSINIGSISVVVQEKKDATAEEQTQQIREALRSEMQGMIDYTIAKESRPQGKLSRA